MLEPYPRPDRTTALKEARKPQPKKAYLFDVDGVITHLKTRRVEEPAIFDELTKRLQKGEPVGLNTGRSLEFMTTAVLDPLEQHLTDRSLLRNMIAIGEKGSAWIVYDQEGNRTTHVDESVSVPQVIQQEVRNFISNPPYNNFVFYDETKQTMISVELQKGKTIDDFAETHQRLNEALQQLLLRYGLQDSLRIDPTSISTDIENVHVGKALGAKRFVEILQERGIEPEEFIGFGDSASDFYMKQALDDMGKNSQFVFVGKPDQFGNHPRDGIIFTQEANDKGTVAFLQQEEK